jgi:hypothetical protein
MGSTSSEGWGNYHVLGEHMQVTVLFFELYKLDDEQSPKTQQP